MKNRTEIIGNLAISSGRPCFTVDTRTTAYKPSRTSIKWKRTRTHPFYCHATTLGNRGRGGCRRRRFNFRRFAINDRSRLPKTVAQRMASSCDRSDRYSDVRNVQTLRYVFETVVWNRDCRLLRNIGRRRMVTRSKCAINVGSGVFAYSTYDEILLSVTFCKQSLSASAPFDVQNRNDTPFGRRHSDDT